MIAEDKILEIKNSSDILEIISEFVILKQAGKNHIGLCPFHTEKTPSFTVNPEKQIYKCFGCGEGGNVFTFLMKKNGVTFPEVLRSLGKRYGIDLPSPEMTPGQKRKYQEKEHYLNINQLALAFFRQQLFDKTHGPRGMGYLEKRGFTRATIDHFEIGYVPDGWDNLVNFFFKKKVPHIHAGKAGLIISKENNRFYDRFRDRIIFPIHNMNRQVIAFGGRLISDSKSQPKYLNSPETPLYHKKTSLYGIDKARAKCRETQTVFIVEGYFDLLALYQHGIENTVATLGTSLTEQHVKILKGIATTIYLVYDSDQAGIKAAERGLSIFHNEGIDAKVIVLPSGQDPDSFIFAQGPEKFRLFAKNALSAILFLIDTSVKRHGLSIEGKLRIVQDVAPLLAEIKDIVARSLYIRELSERIGIDESAINEKIVGIQRNSRPVSPGFGSDREPIAKPYETEFKDIKSEQWRMERQMISMVLQFPEIINEFRENDLIDYFENKTLRHIGQLILENDNKNAQTASDLISIIESDPLKKIIADLAMGEEGSWVKEGCLQLINQFLTIKKRAKASLSQRIKMAEALNDDSLLESLLKEKNLHLASMKKKQYIAGQR